MTKRFLPHLLNTSLPFPFSFPFPPSPISSSPFSHRFFHSTTTNSPLPGLVDDSGQNFRPNPSISIKDLNFLQESNPPGPPHDVVTLLSNVVNNSCTLFDSNTQKCLRQYRDKLNENVVIGVLKMVKNSHLGVEFFVWAGQQVGYRNTNNVYDTLLGVMGHGDNGRIPDYLLREIGEDDRVVLGRMLNLLVRKCCFNGRWNLALEEFGRLKEFGYKPTRMTYDALVRVFLEAGRLETADLVYKEMSSYGFRLDVGTLSLFVYVLCKDAKLREAMELIEGEDVVPDTKMYTRIISGLCEASRFDEAIEVLREMRCGSSLPNVVTYRVLLCGCLNKKELGRCKRILSMMMDEGCYPSRKIFNSLVHAYCKSGEYSYAYKLLKKMADCGCAPGYLVYNILIGGICCKELVRLDELELAEKAYNEMLVLGSVLNKINVSNFCKWLCQFGKFDKAYKVIHEMTSKGFVPDGNTYSNVIELLCNGSKLQEALSLFEEMKRNGIVPDVYTYTKLIDGFCKAGLVSQARKWLDEMIMNGCSPSVVTYTALIHALLKARMLDDAENLFEMMLLDGCVPNVVTYTALIDGYCKSGCIEKACQIYSRMRGQKNLPDIDLYFKIDSSEMLIPNVFTYGALVDGLCKAHKVRDARDLLETMFSDGCEPNQIVYDSLIDGFCKAGELDKAQEVFEKMSNRGYSPTEYTYSSLIDRMFKDNRLDLALKVLSKMLEHSCVPNVVIYTIMVDGLCKSNKTNEAYKLMSMMNEKGSPPNVVTYTTMIDGFGKAGMIEKSLELFSEMQETSCAPNYVTYRVLINHCCSFGFLDKAYELLEEMKQTYWPMHMTNYKKVIDGFNQEFMASLGLLDVLSDTNLVPIAPIYKVLVDSFCKEGRLEVAVKLCKEMSSMAHYPAVTNLYSSLIKSLCLVTKIDEGFELFTDLIRNGGVPDPSVFFDLILALIKLNRWEEALQLSYSANLMGINWIAFEEIAQRK